MPRVLRNSSEERHASAGIPDRAQSGIKFHTPLIDFLDIERFALVPARS
ncbi:MAG: hypothetical protein ACI8QC_000717 [Planctomycetota bacterium]|jgi:hypothetical protein